MKVRNIIKLALIIPVIFYSCGEKNKDKLENNNTEFKLNIEHTNHVDNTYKYNVTLEIPLNLKNNNYKIKSDNKAVGLISHTDPTKHTSLYDGITIASQTPGIEEAITEQTVLYKFGVVYTLTKEEKEAAQQKEDHTITTEITVIDETNAEIKTKQVIKVKIENDQIPDPNPKPKIDPEILEIIEIGLEKNPEIKEQKIKEKITSLKQRNIKKQTKGDTLSDPELKANNIINSIHRFINSDFNYENIPPYIKEIGVNMKAINEKVEELKGEPTEEKKFNKAEASKIHASKAIKLLEVYADFKGIEDSKIKTMLGN
jgi:hypothetical protein